MVHELEEWRPLVGYEGLYEISSLGRVRSLTRVSKIRSPSGIECSRTYPGKLLSVSRDGHGYRQFTAVREGREETIAVRRALCAAFYGPRPSRAHQAAHANGNRADDRVDNLRWATPLENAADRDEHGTTYWGERQHLAKLREADIPVIRARHKAGETQKAIAASYGVSKNTIQKICAGTTWKRAVA